MTKYPSLTIIRFFAAFLVFCSHYGQEMFAKLGDWAVNLFCRGGEAVILFYLLSGFLITVVYEKRVDTGLKVGKFYLARFARIYPLYALALVIHAPFFYRYVLGTNRELFFDANFFPAVVGMKFLMLDPYHMPLIDQSGWLLQGWSLGCELLFYLCFPLVAKYFYNIRDSRLLVGFFAATLAAWLIHAAPLWLTVDKESTLWASRDTALQFMPPARILDFVVGVFAALVVLRLDSIRTSMARYCGYILVLTLAFQAFSPVGLSSESWHLLVFRLLYVGLIASLYCLDREKPYKETKLVSLGVLAGEISFAMYLFQGIVYDYVSLGIRSVLNVHLSPTLSFAVVLPILLAACYLLHKRFELPTRDRILSGSKRV
ncbi:MAG TPA: acyltransferase [Fimbriimonas sp.]|nr:acyltransferase [Fimbriimonas sp.]